MEEQGREAEGECYSPNYATVIHSTDRCGRSTFSSIEEAFAALCRSTHLTGSQLERGKGISLEDASPTSFAEVFDSETVPLLHWISGHNLIEYDSIRVSRGDHGNAPEAPETYSDPTSLQDFGVDRTGAHVERGQFWAIHDYITDRMPRFYCLVDEVKEAPTFSMDVVLLEPTSEVDDWLMSRSFAPATGEFRLSEWKITCCDRTMLSQLMDVGMREDGGAYEVCPQVGEVWALYADYGEVVDLGAARRQRYDLGLIEGRSAEDRACRLRKLERVEVNLWATRGEPRWYLYEDYLGRFSHRVPAVPVPCGLHGSVVYWVVDPCSLPVNDLAPDTSTELRRIAN